jgi:hypothetical protein
MPAEIRTGWSLDKRDESLERLFFPGGMPARLDPKKIVKGEEAFMGSGNAWKDSKTEKLHYMYSMDGTADIKSFIAGIKSAEDRVQALKVVISVMASTVDNPSPYFKVGISGKIRGTDQEVVLPLIADKPKKMTYDQLEEILAPKKPQKTLLRTIMNELDLVGSDREKLIGLILNSRVEAYRLLNSKGVQFTKEQLVRITDSAPFNNPTFSGVFASSDRADIMNRRAVVFYQDACDSDIVFKMLDSIQDQSAKDSFITSLTRWERVREKFKDDPRMALLLKLI